MGYTTDFTGYFDLDHPLTREHARYLLQFANTRRMRRDAELTAKRRDDLREAVGLPTGPEGGYFVGAGGVAGQEDGPDVLDFNRPPAGQLGLWCQWVPALDGAPWEIDDEELPNGICWDTGEKFYDYEEWLWYLIVHFLGPWGYTLNGSVRWQGESSDDAGWLIVRDNVVTTRVMEEPDPDAPVLVRARRPMGYGRHPQVRHLTTVTSTVGPAHVMECAGKLYVQVGDHWFVLQ